MLQCRDTNGHDCLDTFPCTPSAWHSNIAQDRNEMLDVPAMIDIENNLFFMD